MKKIHKTIFIAFFVSIASQIKFNFLTDGFIVAMSVVVMSIFVYCYEDLSPVYVGVCSGIFSPLFRLAVITINGGTLEEAAFLAIPDAVFFFSYGLFYTFIYRYLIRKPKDIRNFPMVIFCCDLFSNCTEMLARSLLQGVFLFNAGVITSLLVVAFLRTVLIQVILLAMEAYSNLLLRQEHDKEYRKLLIQASVFESELYVMEKNTAEIEDIMRQAFELYRDMEKLQAPQSLRDRALDISKNAHEVKGDYLNILDVLKDTYLDGVHERKMSMRDIISIERLNMQSLVKRKGFDIEVHTRVRTNFLVEQYFKMMSVVRNLMLNAIEAMGEQGGKVTLILNEEKQQYILKVRDNGPGISQNRLDTVFLEFYSTKFDPQTGKTQRGVGLSLVKDYVENYFGGRIEVESIPGEFTEFVITMQKGDFEEAEYEVLSD